MRFSLERFVLIARYAHCNGITEQLPRFFFVDLQQTISVHPANASGDGKAVIIQHGVRCPWCCI